jgi:hypothetical protein
MSSGDHDCLPLEAQLEQIRQWFKTYVDARFPGAEARCLPNTHKSSLSGIIEEQGLLGTWPSACAWEMILDIALTYRTGNSTNLLLAKVHRRGLTIAHVGEMVCYSLVARPALAFVVTTQALSPALSQVLWKQGHWDLLKYGKHYVGLIRWDKRLKRGFPLCGETLPIGMGTR